jgi:DNA invertase Pin-like site-specific DNA recombinase
MTRLSDAINGMLLDMLAAVARKDYDDRRRRQAQGQARAKSEGRYKGRPEDTERNEGIIRMISANPGPASRLLQAVLARPLPRLRSERVRRHRL